MTLSEAARAVLEWLSIEYVKAKYPNHREWMVAPNPQEWEAFAELGAHGYIEPRLLRGGQQGWGLTDFGKASVMHQAQSSRNHVISDDATAASGRRGGVFEEYASRLTKEQRSILDHAAAFQLRNDTLIEGKHVRLLFRPEEGDHVYTVLQSLVPGYLEVSSPRRPFDTYALTPAGLLLSPGNGRASKLIEDVLLLFRSRLAQNPTFNNFSWEDLKRLGFALGDDEFPLVHVTIKTMKLNGGGNSTLGPPPSFNYALPHDIEELRRFEFCYHLLDLRQRQYEERVQETQRYVERVRQPIDAVPPETVVPINVHYHGPVHMAPTYASTITDSNVGGIAQGGHASVVGSVATQQGDLTQKQHRALLKEAQKALLDDEEKLDALIYEALGLFLRVAREIQVEEKQLAEVQVAMTNALDQVWAQRMAMGMKPQALPLTLEVVVALTKHPAAGAVVKKLLEA